MKKVSEVFHLPLRTEGYSLIDSENTYLADEGIDDSEPSCIILDMEKEKYNTIANCLNTYDQLKEERDEAVALLKGVDVNHLRVLSDLVEHYLDRVRKNSTTVSGDDTDKEK